jgi:uncharacterized membrane protein YhhN
VSSVAWGLASLTMVAAITDWWAVWTEQLRVRWVAKPATLALLIGVAITLTPADPTIRAWMVVGLVLSLGGDVLLMLPERFFVGGLVSFLLGHVAYVVALQLAPSSVGWTLIGVAVVAACIATVGRRIVGGIAASDHRAMVGPVVAYLLVISAMVVSAFATAALFAVAGAFLFYASDATLAWNRFLERRRFGPLTVMVTYHLGQMGLVAWLV